VVSDIRVRVRVRVRVRDRHAAEDSDEQLDGA